MLVIRVDFVRDWSQGTTGDGGFSQGHGTAYTEELVQDLADWLQDVSGGVFLLGFDVMPQSGAFRMPHQMEFYGDDGDWVQGVCLLLRDAVEAADPNVDFSQYDAVMVVHAGSGQEADILGDSPDDIGSVFLTLADLSQYVPGGLGIPTDDGVYVQEGIIVPEQQTQDGYGLGVLGTMVHEFMHQLGLPDLYDTVGGGVGVGGWDIMGYGQWMMSGFWPTGPGAWTRAQLGWCDIVYAWEDTTLDLAPSGTVLRVPLTGTEYLLVENRQRDPDGDGLCGDDEHDFALPGPGLLIWHVDAGVVSSGLPTNTVNADPEHKGVDLEEADGIQDFDYSLPDIYGIMGSPYDPFFQGGYARELGPETVPSSATSWGGATGVTVLTPSAPGAVMQVSVSRDLSAPGWPALLGPVVSGPVVWEALDGPLVLYTSPVGIIWALGGDPEPQPVASGAFGSQASAEIDGRGHLLWCSLDGMAHLLDADGSERPGWPVRTGPPAALMIAPEAGLVFVATVRGEILCLEEDGTQSPGWPVQLDEQPSDLALVPGAEPLLAVATLGGGLALFGMDGSAVPGWPAGAAGGEPSHGPLCCDADRDGESEIFMLCCSTLTAFDTGGGVEPGFPRQTRGVPMSGPWLCDPDSDGRIDIAMETDQGLEVYEASGAPLLDTPELLDGDPVTPAAGPGGTGGTGFLLHFLRDGRIFARDGLGEPIDGFPLSVGDDPVGAPVLTDDDGDGFFDLTACDGTGWACRWPDAMHPGAWFPGLDWSGSDCWPEDLLPPLAPGGPGIAAGSFFVYPNPVTGDAGTIRFEPGTPCAWTVRVFDLAGELVTREEGQSGGGMAVEVAWDVRDLAPGVYFVCLDLSTGASALFHAAVVKE